MTGVSALLAVVGALAGSASASKVIPTPSAAQLRYQSSDFVALIHFNMATFAHNGDPGCDASNWDVLAPYATGKTRDPATFNPKKLNTTQWFDSISALNAGIAVLTAKHGCGFLLWPTNATIEASERNNGTAHMEPYGYNVGAKGAAIERDVAREFVESAKQAGVGYGFYYSIMKNFYLCRGFTGGNTCGTEALPGQKNVSESVYKQVVIQHLNELWTSYGDLAEVWSDSKTFDEEQSLMNKLQPSAVGSTRNPIGWCGTESGHPSKDVGAADVWSLGDGFHGDKDADFYEPKFCDPQVFKEHIWFWEPNHAVRSLAEMVDVYHDIVGRGMVMELAVAVDRDGLVAADHERVYKQLGSWIKSCYGSPLGVSSGRREIVLQPDGVHAADYVVDLASGNSTVVDRVQIEEDIVLGQRIRQFSVDAASVTGNKWTQLAMGQAVGRKRIVLLSAPVTLGPGGKMRLRVTSAVATPVIRAFGIYKPCAIGPADGQEVYV
eukprot:TRINITY_DN102321_c0_g1_i1.p1 TRINITY_DN102321_c0_g1~~TRINITY_DN102321_c0_g1_i1.p1  ORF type:complete len:494 (+),score=95.62 TRINITY_DN102321_c0_g1_i1:103-1584(+)